MKLSTLKPRLSAAPSRLQSSKAGDARIRGGALQVIRSRILTRDAGMCRCARCLRDGFTRPASIVDHRTPLWAGGKETDSNRQAISRECHDLKSAHEAACRARGVFVPWDGA